VKWSCNASLATKRRKIDSELSTLLKLTESAAIITEGQKDEIHPVKAFQCFVALHLSEQQRIDRTKLAEVIWPGVEKKNQADRLRPTLTRLKNELDRLGLTDLVNSNRSQIWLSRRIPTDLDLLLEGQIGSLSEVGQFLKPILAGWEPGIGQSLRKRVESRLEQVLLLDAFNLTPALACQLEPILERFLDLYPTNSTITGLAYRVQSEFGSATRAKDLVIRFEDAWVDEYGHVDLPKISEIASKFSVSASPPPKRRPSLRLAIPAIFLVPLLWFFTTRAEGPGVWKRNRFVIQGASFDLLEVVPPGDRKILDAHAATDGTIIGDWTDNAGTRFMFDWSGSQFREARLPSNVEFRADKVAGTSLFRTFGLGDSRGGVIRTASNETQLPGSPNQPRIILAGLLPDGRAAYETAGTDVDISHRSAFMIKLGERPKPLASFKKAVRVYFPTFYSDGWTYGVATEGPNTNWSQFAFRSNGSFTECLGSGFPQGVLANGDLFAVQGDNDGKQFPSLIRDGKTLLLPNEIPPLSNWHSFVVGGLLLVQEDKPDLSHRFFCWDGSKFAPTLQDLPPALIIRGGTWDRNSLMVDDNGSDTKRRFFILKRSKSISAH
jgi:hypothetical protein